MKIYCTLFALLILVQCAVAQKISGDTWEGYLDQSEAASKMEGYKEYWEKGLWQKGKKTHDLKLTFKYDEKKKTYTGEYYINESVNEAHYARFSLKATVADKKVTYTTTGIIFETKNILNLGFCHSTAVLTYRQDKFYEYLEGEWKGWNEDKRECAAAHVMVKRRRYDVEDTNPVVVTTKIDTPVKAEIVVVEKIDTVVELNIKTTPTKIDTVIPAVVAEEYKNRKLVTKETMHVAKDSILLEIWDSNREDGDIISLDLNGKIILQEYKLVNAKKSMYIQLNKGENIITLLAHNLGEIPPNTAAFSIEREGGRKTFVLESDMGKSEAVKIIVE